MISQYSKPSSDIKPEAGQLAAEATQRFEKQRALSSALSTFPLRSQCVCCGKSLEGQTFSHRGTVLTECSECGHIQTKHLPPPDYPHNVSDGLSFAQIYRPLSPEEYLDRRNRIYRPKFDWLLLSLQQNGYAEQEILSQTWIEIGSGAGYFLSAAAERGVQSIAGFEADGKLVEASQLHNPALTTHHWSGGFEEILDTHEADLYCSFFVLEHIPDQTKVWKSLRAKKPGTLFAFSVPLFGFSCLLEQCFPSQYARTLDAVVHTQLFTEKSIKRAMEISGCQLIGEWIFGQDMDDARRMLEASTDTGLRETNIYKTLTDRLNGSHDEFQGLIDRTRLADQRHLLAVRV